MAFQIPTLESVRKLAQKITKPVSYTVLDEDTGQEVTFKGKLEGCCEDTAEGIAELAEAQNKERLNFARGKVVLAGGKVTAGEIHEHSPAGAGLVFRGYIERPDSAKQKGRKQKDRGGVDPALIPAAEVAPTNGEAGNG